MVATINNQPDQANHSMAPSLRWLFSFVSPHRRSVVGLMLLSLLATSLVLIQPYLTKLLIDDGIIAKDFDRLLDVAIALLVIGFISTALSGISRYWHTSLSAKVLFSLRESVYRHLQSLSPAFYGRHRSGDILSRLDGDVAEIQRFALDGLFAAVSGAIGLIGAVSLLFYLQWQLALVVLVLLPVEWLYLRWMRPKVEQGVRKVRERSANISSFLVETVSTMKAIQTMAAESREAKRLEQLNHDYLNGLLRLQITEFQTQAVPNTLTSTTRGLAFILGGYWVIQGNMELGSLIAFSTYLGMAVGPVHTLLGLYMGLQRMRVSLDRVKVLTESQPDIKTPQAPPLANSSSLAAVSLTSTLSQGEIQFTKVCFSYPGTEQATIAGSSFCLPAASKVGIYGPSGSGKTTLVDLLLRHFDPQQGQIVIDGHDLTSLDLTAWRRQVAVVAQDVVLFHASLLDNIRYANPEATVDEVNDAVKQAQLQSWLETLPDGLDTIIGERGMNISGGQRQRIALARALLQKPLIVILDEATSAVDQAAEAAIMAVIDQRFADKTRLIISHRDAPLANVDYLLTIEQGIVHLHSSLNDESKP